MTTFWQEYYKLKLVFLNNMYDYQIKVGSTKEALETKYQINLIQELL